MISPFHGEFFTKHKEERNKKSLSLPSYYAVVPWNISDSQTRCM
ncbi:hypothetical protein Q4534_06520 [Cyclobacterium sp. 1_MG-2023]|nr:hypothetical protein [Cyclobacterium sp. 1_MG-2023]MDO6437050.1 hypothetical protein [Cyclobacterium sp. 1_MG-2023]